VVSQSGFTFNFNVDRRFNNFNDVSTVCKYTCHWLNVAVVAFRSVHRGLQRWRSRGWRRKVQATRHRSNTLRWRRSLSANAACCSNDQATEATGTRTRETDPPPLSGASLRRLFDSEASGEFATGQLEASENAKRDVADKPSKRRSMERIISRRISMDVPWRKMFWAWSMKYESRKWRHAERKAFLWDNEEATLMKKCENIWNVENVQENRIAEMYKRMSQEDCKI